MTAHTTTTPAYVRTAAGVVKVAAGECVPCDALPSEVERLLNAGVIVEAAPEAPSPAADASNDPSAGETVADPKPKRPRRPKAEATQEP